MNRTSHRAVALAALSLLAASALAQHQDVEVGVAGSLVVIENGTVAADGSHVFSGPFGELGSPFGTDDPGFITTGGDVMQPGEILAYEATAELLYWDGNRWTSNVPDAERVIITDVIGQQTTIETTGVILPVGFVDAADSSGGLHTHIDFELDNSAGTGDPSDGAYLIELSLFGLASDQVTQVYENSPPVRIAFGMGDVSLSSAVDALLAESDGDAVLDIVDNCTDVANATQLDSDGDGIGNRCDPDIQVPNDCVVSFGDLATLKAAFFSSSQLPNWNPDADFSGDGAVNFADLGIQKDFFFSPPGPSAAGCN
ncbi:MAG: hypothetical protein AAGD86_01365 [Pseudomonadota bacterium]